MKLGPSIFLSLALLFPATGRTAEADPPQVAPGSDRERQPLDPPGPTWKDERKKGKKAEKADREKTEREKAERAEKGANGPGPGNRERWETLTPAEREKLREIYRRLQDMPSPERSRLLEKLRGMGPEERREAVEKARARVREQRGKSKGVGRGAKDDGEGSPAGPKKRFRGGAAPAQPEAEALAPPADSRRLLDAVERWRQGLPFDVRERTRFFTRAERLALFRSYRESEILARTFQDESERAFLLALPRDKLRSLLAPELAARPEGISEAGWERWRDLRPSARKMVLRRLETLGQERFERDRLPPPPPAPSAVPPPARTPAPPAPPTPPSDQK
jgi:hypothetical protein